jgi:hypothetical protein
MLELALAGNLEEWTVALDRLPGTADFVADLIRERYPSLDIPIHARWRHLVFDGRALWPALLAGRPRQDRDAIARAAFDLVMLSVLLDAGAGPGWRYRDAETGLILARSEGLALASARWFASGALSDDRSEPYRVDAKALLRVDADAIARAFQASDANPLLGLPGRAALLNRLGATMHSRPDLFARHDSARPGGLYDVLRARADDAALPAATILDTLLEALGAIWQDRPVLEGIALGDCWPHPAFGGPAAADGYVPLHKLSQWLAYSLLEPLEEAGISVTDVDGLTGLAEYRNGGLFVDTGVLVARDPQAAQKTYRVAEPFVVGWRSLTVAMLDRLAPLVGSRLGLTPQKFPLARLLEGGTWAAGRVTAQRARADGGPPFHILSDGTVF